jgi:hypothetical protein
MQAGSGALFGKKRESRKQYNTRQMMTIWVVASLYDHAAPV